MASRLGLRLWALSARAVIVLNWPDMPGNLQTFSSSRDGFSTSAAVLALGRAIARGVRPAPMRSTPPGAPQPPPAQGAPANPICASPRSASSPPSTAAAPTGDPATRRPDPPLPGRRHQAAGRARPRHARRPSGWAATCSGFFSLFNGATPRSAARSTPRSSRCAPTSTRSPPASGGCAPAGLAAPSAKTSAAPC